MGAIFSPPKKLEGDWWSPVPCDSSPALALSLSHPEAPALLDLSLNAEAQHILGTR